MSRSYCTLFVYRLSEHASILRLYGIGKRINTKLVKYHTVYWIYLRDFSRARIVGANLLFGLSPPPPNIRCVRYIYFELYIRVRIFCCTARAGKRACAYLHGAISYILRCPITRVDLGPIVELHRPPLREARPQASAVPRQPSACTRAAYFFAASDVHVGALYMIHCESSRYAAPHAFKRKLFSLLRFNSVEIREWDR